MSDALTFWPFSSFWNFSEVILGANYQENIKVLEETKLFRTIQVNLMVTRNLHLSLHTQVSLLLSQLQRLPSTAVISPSLLETQRKKHCQHTGHPYHELSPCAKACKACYHAIKGLSLGAVIVSGSKMWYVAINGTVRALGKHTTSDKLIK